LAEIEVGRWGIDALNGAPNDLGTCRVGKPLELFQVLVDVRRVVGAFARRAN
jgi:hypothetical protein